MKEDQLDESLSIGAWRVDAAGDRLLRNGSELKLEPRLMRLLLALARRPGQTVTAETLLGEVWPDVVVTPDSVYQAVAKLRRALDDHADEPTYIATVPRRGYRLVAPVQPAPAAVASAIGLSPSSSAAPAAAPPFGAWWAWLLGAGVVVIVAAVLVAMREVPREVKPEVTAEVPAGERGVAAAGPASPRLVVLPFDDASDDGRTDGAFVAGLSADISSAVESLAGARVAAHSAAQMLTQQEVRLPEIGKRLDVEHALRGRVRRSADRIDVDLELVDPATAQPRWSRRFEIEQSAASTLPQQVAAALGDALQITNLQPASAAPSARSFAAYEAYLQAGQFLRQATPESIELARDHFQRAIDLDAGFERAYTGQALAWMAARNFSGVTLSDAAAKAQPLIDRALQLKPDSAFAHAVQGFILLEQQQLERATAFLQRALELNPNYFSAHLWSGMAAAYDGRPRDALPHYLRAGQLDPTNFFVPILIGVEESHVAAYESARRHFATALELAPQHPNGQWGSGIVAFAQGQLDEAALAYERALALSPQRFDLWRQLAWIYLDLGLPGEATRAFQHAQRIAPSLTYLRVEAARAHLMERDTSALEQAIDFVLSKPPAAPDALAHVALLYAARGDTARAGALAQESATRMAADSLKYYGAWDTFLGQLLPLDLAATLRAAGQADAAQPLLELSQSFVERLQQQNIWHALEYHSARLLALQGRRDQSLAALERAARSGFRRGWWLPHDPALQTLRGDPRFEAVVGGLAESSERLRASYLARRAEVTTANRSAPSPAERKARLVTSAPPAASERRTLVLWVDDRPSNNARERDSLAALGLRFVLAISTEQALDEIERQPFALIISDMGRGPDLRAGYTLLRELRAKGNRTPLLFYTDSCTDAQMAEAKRNGAVGCASQVSELMQRSLAVLERRP